MDATIRKLNLRLRIKTHDVFQKKTFKNVEYADELGLGEYLLSVSKDGKSGSLIYKPKEAKAEYALFKGKIGADGKISTNGLELVLQESVLKEGNGLDIDMEFLPLEETVENLRDAMGNRALGSNNLEIRLKDRDPFLVSDILNTLRLQFLEVYYGTTEVQDVGI